jgi:hypothetical protein
LLHVCNLGLNVFRREVCVERISYALRLGQSGKHLQQTDQHPVTVHRRMPVVTTVKSRMQSLRALYLARVVDDVFGLIRKLSRDTLQRERREV